LHSTAERAPDAIASIVAVVETSTLIEVKCPGSRLFPGSHAVIRDPEGNEFCVAELTTLA
jgi:hypothetical protein